VAVLGYTGLFLGLFGAAAAHFGGVGFEGRKDALAALFRLIIQNALILKEFYLFALHLRNI